MVYRYIGSGPYCYSNSLAMAMADGSDPGLLEVLTGAPFGLQLLDGRRALFSPLGWDPGKGIDAALELLGWMCEPTRGGDQSAAMERLREAAAAEPVLAGPLEMGLLLQHPDASGPIGADHYVVVTEVNDGYVRFHDPQGYPYSTLPADAFAAAWRAETIDFTDTAYTMRARFRRVREVSPSDALRACVPAAIAWLDQRAAGQAEPAGPGEAALALADLAEAGLTDEQRDDLAWFSVPVGARRASDAEYWLGQIGMREAARVCGAQARLIGGLQHPVVAGDGAAMAEILRKLGPTYRQLRQALSREAAS